MIANGQLVSWFHGAFCGGYAQVPGGMAEGPPRSTWP